MKCLMCSIFAMEVDISYSLPFIFKSITKGAINLYLKKGDKKLLSIVEHVIGDENNEWKMLNVLWICSKIGVGSIYGV